MRVLFVLCILGTLLGGCTAAPQPTNGRHAWTVPHVLRIDDFAQPDTLNPYLSEMDVSYAISSLVYSYLIVADDRGDLVGDLATEVPSLANGGISADGRTYTYHLRRGVHWQDGVAFTSADVVASWRAVVDPSHQTVFRNGYDRIVAIATPDEHTVVVNLRERYPPFISQFFAPLQEGGKPILAAHLLRRIHDFNHGALADTAVGTGPFKLAKWSRGEGITLVRNDSYFRGRPGLDRIEYRFVPDPQTIATEMRTHQTDLLETPPAGIYPLLKAIPDLAISLGPWNAQMLLAINHRSPGLGDLDVRHAISLAIDRAVLVRTAAHGTGALARDIVAPGQLGYTVRESIRRNVRTANALLDRSGWKRRPSYTVATIAGSATTQTIALELQSELRDVGIGLTIKPYAYPQLYAPDGPLRSGHYDLALFGSVLSWDPDSHVYYGCDQQYPHGQNIFGYCNRAYDALEAQALSSDDPGVRGPLYSRADGVLWNDVAYIPLYQFQRIVAHNPDLLNYRPNATSTPWWNAWQWDI